MMLRQALVALGPRTLLPVALAGSAALAAGVLLLPRDHATSAYRLSLHAPVEANTFYLSVWNEGEVFVGHDGRDRRPVVFTRRGDEHDGCTWLGTERLIPIAPNAYHYSYDETILACRPGARPFRKTPRMGIVTVDEAAGAAELTAFDGVQPPADLWNPPLDDFDCDDDADLAELQQAVDEAMAEARAAVHEAELAAGDAMRDAEDLLDARVADDNE
jgi:hypothetical protein